jgi:2-dehydropantoate 2-reductase
MSLRVAVIGMGPVGQILSVFLNSGGCTVGIYDKDLPKLQLIGDRGIHLSGLYTEHATFSNIIRTPEELSAFRPELIIIAVKIYHTTTVVDELQTIGLNSCRIICAQNGIDSEAAVVYGFGEEWVYRMVLNFAGNLHEPNHTHVTFFNPPNYLASIDDSGEEFSQYFSDLLTEVGLETIHVNSFWLQNRVWEKTILNAALSALCGITGLTMKEAMSRPDLVAIVERLIDESVEVAKAEEIFFGENFSKICLRYLRNAGDHHPSLAVDMRNNRRTEIDYFNGQFVRYGMKHYVKTPLHFVFTNLVKAHTPG